MFKEDVARVCHEINRAYCLSQGDTSQLPWEEAPDWQKDSAMMGVNLHWDKDESPGTSHKSWMAQKVADGWKHGPVKDPEKKEHPSMVPFEELSKAEQAKDFIFVAVVHSLRPPLAGKPTTQRVVAKGLDAFKPMGGR